jgi:hypothetical protein
MSYVTALRLLLMVELLNLQRGILRRTEDSSEIAAQPERNPKPQICASNARKNGGKGVDISGATPERHEAKYWVCNRRGEMNHYRNTHYRKDQNYCLRIIRRHYIRKVLGCLKPCAIKSWDYPTSL